MERDIKIIQRWLTFFGTSSLLTAGAIGAGIDVTDGAVAACILFMSGVITFAYKFATAE